MTDLNPPNESSDDQRLIEACIDGNPLAWQQLVDRFLPVILLTVTKLDEQADRDWDTTEKHERAIRVFEYLKSEDFQPLRTKDRDLNMETWLILITRRLALSDNKPPKIEL